MECQPIHIGLNAQLLSLSQSYRGAGISWYMVNLLQRLGQVSPAHFRYSAFLSDRAFRSNGLNLNRSQLPTQQPLVRIFWEQAIQPVALRLANVDVLHALAFVAPLVTVCPFVVTVYDLSFMRFPEAFRPFNRWYLRTFTTRSVRRAAAVVTISDSTRRDVIDLLGVAPDKVRTVYCGVDATFQPRPAAEVEAFRAKHSLPEHFILFLGTLEPRKNVDGLIRAYAAWKQREPTAPPLIIAGGKGWYYQTIFELVESLNLAGSVYFPGYVPSAELPLWYNAADLLVYPSHFEGFGLPVLEAMACGTPVITSTASSLPEVAGSAARLVASNATAALTGALSEVMSRPDLRFEMRAQGLRQAARFSWDQTARQTVAVYTEVIERYGKP